jgi:hypothetical protein
VILTLIHVVRTLQILPITALLNIVIAIFPQTNSLLSFHLKRFEDWILPLSSGSGSVGPEIVIFENDRSKGYKIYLVLL